MQTKVTWILLLSASACALDVGKDDSDGVQPPPTLSPPLFAGSMRPPPQTAPERGRAETPARSQRTASPYAAVPGADAGCGEDSGACTGRGVVCISNEDCSDGLCVNARCRDFCEADADCGDAEACVLGLCRTRPSGGFECLGASDCPAADDCVGASCVRRCVSDEDCSACDDGTTCSFGYCGR